LKKYLNIKTFFLQNKLQYFLLNFSVESNASLVFKKEVRKERFFRIMNEIALTNVPPDFIVRRVMDDS
jgi:hypothetical protein